MNQAKLISALRCDETDEIHLDCEYYGNKTSNCVLCDQMRLRHDAAAEIEKLVKERDEAVARFHLEMAEKVADGNGFREIIDGQRKQIDKLQAEVDELQARWNGAEICGYNARNLIMFADACKEQHVTNEDLKKVATDLTWAVQTVYDAAKRAMENVSFKMTDNGCVASMKYIFPPPVNPDRLKDMDFKWDISGCKSVKISDIKYKEMQSNDENRPD